MSTLNVTTISATDYSVGPLLALHDNHAVLDDPLQIPFEEQPLLGRGAIEAALGVPRQRGGEVVMIDQHRQIVSRLPPAVLQLQAEIIMLAADASLPAHVIEHLTADEGELGDVVTQPRLPESPAGP